MDQETLDSMTDKELVGLLSELLKFPEDKTYAKQVADTLKKRHNVPIK